MADDYFAECSWQATVPPGDSLYPPGYRDPDYDGTEAGFAEKVIPARADAIAEGLNERFADVLPDGMRFEWGHEGGAVNYWPLEDAEPAAGEPELLARKESAAVLMSQALVDDCAGMDDLIGKVFRGEIELKPPPEPKRHRCLACWLVSLLSGHERCEHGYLYCDDCRADY